MYQDSVTPTIFFFPFSRVNSFKISQRGSETIISYAALPPTYKCMIPAEYPNPAKTIHIPQNARDLVYQPHKH